MKNIKIDFDVLEMMIFFWESVASKDKMGDDYFMSIAEKPQMEVVYNDDFSKDSVRRVMSAISYREKLNNRTLSESRFWNNNMWMMEDLELPKLMAKPIKVLNVNHLIDELNKEFPNNNKEILKVYIAPLHMDDYYIVDGNLIINFFRIMLPDGENAFIDGQPIDEYIHDKLKEVLK